eukprot:793442-Alexandrium_andersonii.AAC.1
MPPAVAPVVRTTGPELAASTSPPESPKGRAKRPRRRTGGALVELLEQPTPKFRSCLDERPRKFG